MAKNLLFKTIVAACIIVGLIMIWKLVIPFLGGIFGGSFDFVVNFFASLKS